MSEPLPVGDPVAEYLAGAPMRRSIQGSFVILGPVDPEGHVGALYDATHGSRDAESVWTYMGYGPFHDRDAMLVWLGSLVRSADPLFFTVMDRGTGSPVGVVSFLSQDRVMRRIEIGHIWYAPAAQRTRANTESAYLLLREAFETLRHRRVEWKCDALNTRSRAAAERLGFSFEGVFRAHMIVKGRNRDTAWYSMLDGEWPAVKSNLEAWLTAEPGSVSLRALNAAG